MGIIIGVTAVVLFMMLLIIAALSGRSTVRPTEEKGPMPKRHGGFGPVHGGKS